MTYDEILMEDADKLLSFGNEYAAVIAVENAANGILESEYSVAFNDDSNRTTYRSKEEQEQADRENDKKKAQNMADDAKEEIGDAKRFNNAIKALTAAAAAVTGGAAVKAVSGGDAKTAGIVALASAVVTAAGAVGQHIHDKAKVQQLKADAMEELDDKLEDVTVKLNTAGPSEKRNLLVARDALKKAKRDIVKM